MPAKKPLKTTDPRRETGPPEIKQPRKPKKVEGVKPKGFATLDEANKVYENASSSFPRLFRDRRK